VSVVVLSHNRRELLRRALASVREQGVAGVQTVVVDNASKDGTPELVEHEFPEVDLVSLSVNEGIRGRNLGFAKARAPVVLSLDDDIELLRPDTLERVLGRFESDPKLGALTLKICSERDGDDYAEEHWWHPLPREAWQDREFETDHISEAAVAFRREALEGAGFYYEPLFWGGEEWDLCLGIMDLGYEIHYLPEPVFHASPRGDLNLRADPRHALLVRNRCWIAFRRLPIPTALRFSAPRLGLWALRAARYGYLGAYLRGVFGLLRVLPQALSERRLISAQTRRRLRSLRTPGEGPPAGRLL